MIPKHDLGVAEIKANALRSFWNRHFSSHFFRKALLTYLLTAIAAGIALHLILSQNLVTIKTEQALDMSSQIVDSVDNYLSDKIVSARSIHQKLIMDSENWHSITSRLKSPDGAQAVLPGYSDLRQVVNQTVYAVDTQYYGLFFCGNDSNSVLLFVKSLDTNDQYFFTEWARRARESGKDAGFSLRPARRLGVNGNAYTIFVLSQVNDPAAFTDRIGFMGLSFSALGIRQAYRRFDDYLKGTLQVIDGTGGILYDSRALDILPADYPLAEVTRQRGGSFRHRDHIYNTAYNPTGDYYVVNCIPQAEVQRDITIVRRSIQLVIFIVLILALALTYASSYRLDRRLRGLTAVMDQVRLGNLTGHAAPPEQKDEIGVIHSEFLSVCDSLEQYIQREYIYRIKQKEMEFYALQAQIDPHFLYNTLEAIRMKLLLSGEREASRMIRILSEMFRNIMREDTVVDIRDELSYLRDYLDLYKFRLGDKLEYGIAVEDEVYQFATIRHILQPIIENALIHGFRDVHTGERPGKLSLTAVREGEDVCFVIADNGNGISPQRLEELNASLADDDVFQKSVGICNVSNRLRIVFGSAYRLRIESDPDRGTAVYLRIKAMTKKELRAFVQGIDR